MPLARPPDDPQALRAFPVRTVTVGTSLYRVFRWRDPGTGDPREPFSFASAPTGGADGGRYDLPPPHGACYLAEGEVGAWLEVFRDVGLVAVADVRARRLLTTSVPRPVRAADLLSAAARRFGITNDVHDGDHAVPRRWAARLHASGLAALRGRCRHDSTGSVNVTLLDTAGAHPPYGWSWPRQVTRLDGNVDLLADLAAYGTGIADIPFDVPVDPPP
jgi:hypothetical protein